MEDCKSRFEKESESLGRMIRGEAVDCWKKVKDFWTEEDKDASATAKQIGRTFKQVCDVILGTLIVGFLAIAAFVFIGPLFLIGTIVGAFVWNLLEDKEE